MKRVEREFHDAFDVVEDQFPDVGTIELHEDERAGADNGAGSERQFAYCMDGDPIIIAFAPKAAGEDAKRIRGLMRHELGHALEYRYGVKELEKRLGKLPAEVERRADVIAERVFGEPIVYDEDFVQCVGRRGTSPRPAHLPDKKEKLKANPGASGELVFYVWEDPDGGVNRRWDTGGLHDPAFWFGGCGGGYSPFASLRGDGRRKEEARVERCLRWASEKFGRPTRVVWGEPPIEANPSSVVLRPKGWDASGDEGRAAMASWHRGGHVYRGMTDDEYQATVGAGRPVMSTGAYSHRSEGTSFAEDPLTAESYINYGRDDPRKTGRSTWLVEVRRTPSMYEDRDGYIKSREPVETVTRVWEMFPREGEVVAREQLLSNTGISSSEAAVEVRWPRTPNRPGSVRLGFWYLEPNGTGSRSAQDIYDAVSERWLSGDLLHPREIVGERPEQHPQGWVYDVMVSSMDSYLFPRELKPLLRKAAHTCHLYDPWEERR